MLLLLDLSESNDINLFSYYLWNNLKLIVISVTLPFSSYFYLLCFCAELVPITLRCSFLSPQPQILVLTLSLNIFNVHLQTVCWWFSNLFWLSGASIIRKDSWDHLSNFFFFSFRTFIIIFLCPLCGKFGCIQSRCLTFFSSNFKQLLLSFLVWNVVVKKLDGSLTFFPLLVIWTFCLNTYRVCLFFHGLKFQ